MRKGFNRVKGTSEITEILDGMKGLVADLQEQVASFDETAGSRDRSDRFREFLRRVAQLRAFQEHLSIACRQSDERDSENTVDPSRQSLPQIREQPPEEIVEGLKKGVVEILSEEDYETHYNLGLAYREIGLLDEAIGELQLAAQSTDHPVDCYSLLGSCSLEKGFPDLAIKWCECGLEAQNGRAVRNPSSAQAAEGWREEIP